MALGDLVLAVLPFRGVTAISRDAMTSPTIKQLTTIIFLQGHLLLRVARGGWNAELASAACSPIKVNSSSAASPTNGLVVSTCKSINAKQNKPLASRMSPDTAP